VITATTKPMAEIGRSSRASPATGSAHQSQVERQDAADHRHDRQHVKHVGDRVEPHRLPQGLTERRMLQRQCPGRTGAG